MLMAVPLNRILVHYFNFSVEEDQAQTC